MKIITLFSFGETFDWSNYESKKLGEDIMSSVKIRVDINAHIDGLKCDVVKQNEDAYAVLKFDNLGYGSISAIKFDACGFNSFGDIVLVNGQEKFFLIVQDIEIEKNEQVTSLKAKLPNSDIKRLELQECQICYTNGTVVSYEGAHNCEFEVEEFDGLEEKAAVKKLYSKNAKYKVKEFEEGWICTCGRYNPHENEKCSLCENSKTLLLDMCSEDGMFRIIERYHSTCKEEERVAAEEEKKKQKKARKRNIGICVGIISAIVVIVLISYANMMSKRQTYASVEKMREAMQGNWSHRSEFDYDIMWQLQIEGDKCKRVYDSSENVFEYDITWNPSKGTFEMGNDTFVVERGGQIITEDNYSYDKGGFTLTPGESSDSDSDSYSSYESVYSALKFSEIYVSDNSSYTVCTGKVTNNGNKTYRFVTIKGSFENSYGTVVDTDSTYAIGSEGLAPGESKSFRMSVSKDTTIEDCSISITDYDN